MSSKSKSIKKKKPNPRSFLEQFLTTRNLLLLGLFFLLIGFVFSVSSNDGFNRLWDAIIALLKPSTSGTKLVSKPATGGETVAISNWYGITKLLLMFIPAILILIISYFYYRKNKSISYPISIIVFSYLTILQIALFFNYFIAGWYFPNIYVALVFLIISQFLMLAITLKQRKLTLLLISSCHFYFTTLLYSALQPNYYNYLFFIILVFSAIIAWIGQKLKYNLINKINLVFIIIFFSLFILRKFIINFKPENFALFIVFSTLFYVLYYLITLYATNSKVKPLDIKAEAVLIWTNFLFYLGCCSFLLIQYYSFNYIWILVLALLVFNLIGFALVNKYKLSTHLFPYYCVIILLASLVLPLLIQQNILFLFCLIFGVFMLFYANIKQNKIAFWLSLSALGLSIILFLKLWLGTYFLTMFALAVSPDFNMLWTGTVNGLLLILCLRLIKTQINGISEYINIKWLAPVFKQIVYSLYQIAIFLGLGWILFTLQYIISLSVNSTSVIWLISGCLYFIFYIRQFTSKNSPHKKAAHYLAFGFVLLYPLLMGFTIVQKHIIVSGGLNTLAVILHYIALLLLIILASMTVKRIYKRNGKFLFIQNSVQLLTVIYLVYFVCTELDTLTLVLASLIYSSNTDYILNTSLIELNTYLPYTVALWVLSVAVFMFGVFYHKPFLRMLVLYLFFILLIKLFLFDFEMISAQARSSVFYGLGIFLICFALLYPKIKAATARSKKKYAIKEEE